MQYKDLLLDMLNRIVKLEKEIDILKKGSNEDNKFDNYDQNGPVYIFNDLDYTNGEDSKLDAPWPFFKEKDLGNKRINLKGVSPLERDKTKYLFNGKIYLKNKLVLAIIKDYVDKNYDITCDSLINTFDKSLQGSIGVIEHEHIAKQRKNYETRLFSKDRDVLHLIDGNKMVCSQWSAANIIRFIKRAEQLGYFIEEIDQNRIL